MSSLIRVIAVLLGIAPWAPSRAQDWQPDRPIRLIVPFPPGGTTDIIGRLLAEPVGRLLGQPVVVDNRAGANGNIGIVATARAAPDGQTIAICSFGCITNPAMYQPAPFVVARDLTPILTISLHPMILVMRRDLPVENLAGLVALARSRPDGLTFASPGSGSSGHLGGELLRAISGANLTHVPYRGSAPAIADLMAGRADIYFDTFTNALPHVRAGAIRALATLTEDRQPWMPELPTAAESGLTGLIILPNLSLVGPPGLPAPIATRFNAAFRRTIEMPGVRERMVELGAIPPMDSPEAAAAFLAREGERWGALIRERRIAAE